MDSECPAGFACIAGFCRDPSVDAGGGGRIDAGPRDAGTSGDAGKVCGAVSVPLDDPATGCAGASCAACPVEANEVAVCDPTGDCAVECETDFEDRDASAPGCEAALASDENHCGACLNLCGTNANTTAATCTERACEFTCVDPFAHCGVDDSLGCDTNLGIDSDHCRVCGHSCLGGDCVSGNCLPMVIAGDPAASTGLKSLYGLTVVGDQLFGTNWYQNTGVVYTLPVAGNLDHSVTYVVKAPVVTGAIGGFGDGTSAPTSASPIVNDGAGHVLYGVFRQDASGPAPGVWEASADGSTNRPIVTISGSIGNIAADSTYIYYSEFYGFGLGAGHWGIFRADRATGTDIQRYFYGADDGTRGAIAGLYVSSGSIYFLDAATGGIYAASPTTLGTPILLATVTNSQGGMQADATYLYYFDNGVFYRVRKVGGTPAESITPSGGLPVSSIDQFLVDETYVYFFGPRALDKNVDNGQRIYAFRTDMTSTTAFIVASIGNDNVSAAAQDANALYWTTYGRDSGLAPHSAIYRVAKPPR